jgi:hypothetical protein
MVTDSVLSLPASTRSVLRKLEGLLPQIEEGLAQGYSHAVIHGALEELGITVGLPYYHRALHKLRRERREGKLQSCSPPRPLETPMRDRAQINEAQSSPALYDARRGDDLSVAVAQELAEPMGNMSKEPTQVQTFRWKGQDFLNKDWSNF